MMGLGWEPGQTLGTRDNGIRKPIVAKGQCSKAGLGSGIKRNNLTNNDLQIVEVLKTQSNVDKIPLKQKEVISSLFNEEDNITADRLEIFRSEIGIEIFNKLAVCLVDTGSDITCISESFWETLKSQVGNKLNMLPVKPIQIRGAVGQKSGKIQQMVLLPVKFGVIEMEIRFLIVPKLTHTVILGFDWLTANNTNINLQKPSVGLIIDYKGHRTLIPFIEYVFEGQQVSEIAKVNNGFNFQKYLQEIKTGIPLKGTQVNKLKQVLSTHDNVFIKRLGRANCYEHVIKMIDHSPVIRRSYPVPYAYRLRMEEKLAEMVDMGIISRGSTPYCSPLTFTLKPDGSIRVLLDAREINKNMVAEAEAPPMQMDVLNSFHGVNYISIIDLNNAYFQIPISDDSKKYTGFTFNGKSYMYNVLPQGLKTSVGSFSRAMDQILGPEVKQFCVNYLDDLAILTQGTLDDHLEHINIILEKLKSAGLTCNIEKCKFICKEVKMLGHIISTKGIKTDPEKLESIKKFPVPKKIKHLRAFLGLCNYYRRFIPDYNSVIQPLCQLLKKDKGWTWTPEAQLAFEELKRRFLNTIMLHHPDMSRPFYLQTDSSGVGLAGVLFQYDDKGEMKILGYCSRALRGAELRWTVTEQEFWAIIYCLRKFETYVRGAKLIIRTDHKALTFVRSWKLYNSRIIRWILFLEQFDYSIEHVKGKDNVAVDVLSRFPSDAVMIQEDRVFCPEIHYMEISKNKTLISNLKNISEFQANDEDIKAIIDIVNNRSNILSGRLGTIAKRCYIKDKVLYFRIDWCVL